MENNGIVATIETDKEVYRAGEEIQFTLTVENGMDGWSTGETTFTYSNTDGLVSADGSELPNTLPEIPAGESYSITGTLVGDEAVFGAASGVAGNGLFIGLGVCAAVIIGFLAVLLLRKKKKGAGLLLVLLTMGLFAGAGSAKAADETVTVRPYVKVTYAGQEVTLRAVIQFPVEQDLWVIESEDRQVYQKITCHDPSIFKDVDGSYYIFGTFLCAGRTDNLYDWTNLDSQFQATFTDEVKEQIRAWNQDESAGDWNSYLWAPDIIYNPVMEKYCIYLSANGDNWKSNIVLLTSDTVDGPYDYVGSIVYGGFTQENFDQTDAPLVLGTDTIPERYVTNGIENKKWGDMWPNCIDPCVFYDDDGKLYMAYGSWSGGIFLLELDTETGLRDYDVTYENDIHSDAYFGTKIAGGAYVSGEGSYIQKIGDYYYLFISYGNLEAAGGYNVRVYRSERPDGDYVDMLGNTPFFDSYVFNYNMSTGVRLMGGYKWRNFNNGQVAQGHNSAFVDDDGRAYVVFHTRMDNGTEGHYVKVHQLFTTKEGWLVAAPYQTTGEALKEGGYSVEEIAGDYDIILHELEIDYKNRETMKPERITLTADGKITGAYEGTWQAESGTSYITLQFNGGTYSGVALSMKVEYTTIETMVFTAVGLDDQITLWGSKIVE